MACFMMRRQNQQSFLERLLIEMEDVWWLKKIDLIQKQNALGKDDRNFLDNLCDTLVAAHYYSVNGNFATSEEYLKTSLERVNFSRGRSPRSKQEQECLRISLMFSEIIIISRQMRSDKVEKFMDLYKKFKSALKGEEKLQTSPAGVISSSLVELAYCDWHFRLGPSNHHSLDKILMESNKLELLTSSNLNPLLRAYASRALGDIEYHKGLIYFLKGDNEAAEKRFNTALKYFQEVQMVLEKMIPKRPDPHCRIHYCKNMLMATASSGQNTVNIEETLTEIQEYLDYPELPATVRQKLKLIECSLKLFREPDHEFGQNFLKEFGFHCDETELHILRSFEFLELIERKLRGLVEANKWKDVPLFYGKCSIPNHVICSFSHLFSIMKTLRIVNSKPRSSVRRYTRLERLMMKEIELHFRSLTFWQEKAFASLLKFFARSGNKREYDKLLLNGHFTLPLVQEKTEERLNNSPKVSTRNGVFLYFDNFKDDSKKNLQSVEQTKDVRCMSDLLGIPEQNYFLHDQKKKIEVLDEIRKTSNVLTFPGLEIVIIFFIGHGRAYKRETEFETVLITAQGEEITSWEIKEAVFANLKCFSGCDTPVVWVIVDTCRGDTDLGGAKEGAELASKSDSYLEAVRRYDDMDYCDADFMDAEPLDMAEPSTSAGLPSEEGGSELMQLTTGNENQSSPDGDNDEEDFYSSFNETLESSDDLDSTNSDEVMTFDRPEVIDTSAPSFPNLVVTYATLNLCAAYCVPKENSTPLIGYSPFMKNLLEAVTDEEFYGGQGPWNLRHLQRIVNSKMTKFNATIKDDFGQQKVFVQRSTGEDSLRKDFILSKDI